MRVLRRFFNEKWLELIVAGVCLPFLGAATAVLLANRPDAMAGIAIIILLVVVLFLGLKEWREGRKRPELGGERAFQVPRRGVIFTLGLRSAEAESVVYLVANSLRPEFFGFLSTPQIDRLKIVEEVVSKLKLEEGSYKVESWNLEEIREGKAKTELMIDWMLGRDLSERELVLDLTGGTATMSVAAFMAADEKRIDCQYILSGYNDKNQVDHKAPKLPVLVTNYGQPTQHPAA